MVKTVPVHKDCMVHFEGRSYVVPFTYSGRDVEVRGCSGRVQIVDPQTAAVLISYPRHTQERILIDQACYEGPGTAQVLPPRPLGRMARKLQEIASLPVERRPMDLYAALAEVAPMTLKAGSARAGEALAAKPAKAATADLKTLVDQLLKLGLDFAAEALPAILTRAVKEDLGSPALLEQLLRGELEQARDERRVRTSLRLSGLPTGQTLSNFDFAFQPAVQRSKLDALGTCALAPGKAGAVDPRVHPAWEKTCTWPSGSGFAPWSRDSRWRSSGWRNCCTRCARTPMCRRRGSRARST